MTPLSNVPKNAHFEGALSSQSVSHLIVFGHDTELSIADLALSNFFDLPHGDCSPFKYSWAFGTAVCDNMAVV